MRSQPFGIDAAVHKKIGVWRGNYRPSTPYGNMAFKTSSNAMRGTRGRSYRRRNPIKKAVRRIYRRRPTAKTQQRQIARVTRLALANRRRFNTVYTDWQRTDMLYPPNPANWIVVRLTDIPLWNSVMRMDTNVNEANHTFIKRIQINFTAWITTATTHVNVFIIRPRYNAAGDDPAAQGMVAGTDYIHNPSFQRADVRLNSGKYKVLFSAYKLLQVATLGNTAGGIPGDPSDTVLKRQVNLNVNMKVSTTNLASWHTKPFDDLPYYDKLYLLVLQDSGAFEYDLLATAINTL